LALVIRPQHRRELHAVLSEMHRLRRRVFVERLGWRITGDDGVHEIDDFDRGACLHLVALGPDGRVVATTRLTPSLEPNLTCAVLQEAGDDRPTPRAPHIVEISRLCVDHEQSVEIRRRALKDLRVSQFELCRKHGWSHVLCTTYERNMQPWIRAGGPVDVLGAPIVLPGDREPSFAVLAATIDEGDALIERHAGKLGGHLLDPLDDPSLLDRFGGQRAA